DQEFGHCLDVVEQQAVQIPDARSGQIQPAAIPDEEAIAREDPPRNDETTRVWRVARGVDDFYFELTNGNDRTVLEDQVFPDVTEPMGRDFPSGFIREPLVIVDVVDVVMRVEDESD